ncbi:MAG: glycosyltransferase family 9 protein [Cyanobacteriota bacterium]
MFYDGYVSKDFKRILLVCFGGIGDVILFFPTIKILKEINANSEITLLVEPRCKSVAEKNTNITNVITFDLKNKPSSSDYLALIKKLRNQNFDLAISMGRSAMVPLLLFLSGAKYRVGYSTNKLKFLYSKTVELDQNQYAGKMYFDLLKGIGVNTDILNPIPEIKIPENEIKWSENWFKEKLLDASELKKVIIHPGASNISKQKNIIKTWEPEKWSNLINNLLENNIKVILAGGPDDKEDIEFISNNITNKTNFINAYGETKNLDQLAALIKKVDLLICIDSAPLNLCVGVGTECVAIFGPTNENKILPKNDKFTPVRINLDCTPCLWDKRQTTCQELTCLKKLEVNNILSEIEKKLKINLNTNNTDVNFKSKVEL